MPIANVFTSSDGGAVVTGTISTGSVNVGDEVQIVGIQETRRTTTAGLETFGKLLDRGEPGDNVGVLLHGVKPEDVKRGQVLCPVGSFGAHTRFNATIHMLKAEEGGRRFPFYKGYQPLFCFGPAYVTGTVELPEEQEAAMPGSVIEGIEVNLRVPLEFFQGYRFAIRDRATTVGFGTVSRVLR